MLTPSSWKQKSPNFFFFFQKIILLIYLWLQWVFVAPRAFSSCSQQGLLFIAVPGLLTVVVPLVAKHRRWSSGFSSCSAWAQQLRHISLVAPLHMESSPTRVQIRILWTDRWVLNHWTTREVPQTLNFHGITYAYPFTCFVSNAQSVFPIRQQPLPQHIKPSALCSPRAALVCFPDSCPGNSLCSSLCLNSGSGPVFSILLAHPCALRQYVPQEPRQNGFCRLML